MKLFPGSLLALMAGAALTAHSVDAPADGLAGAPDPAFAPGLAALKQVTGFIEQPANHLSTDWQPNLQLLVGFKAVEKNRRTLYFVELTTLPPPLTNATGQPWQPVLRTNDWAWSSSNKAQFVTSLYPVRVRVFDEVGGKLKEGQTPMSWGGITNGLLDLCRLSLQFFPRDNSAGSPVDRNQDSAVAADKELSPAENEELMRTVGGGFLWMMGMLGDLQTVPAVKNVWEKSRCAIRMPGVWTMVTAVFTGFKLSLEPRLQEVTLAAAGRAGPEYRLPVELKNGQQKLTRAEIIVGPPGGAEMLLAGIRSIRAVHPTKPQNEFLAQVLATGVSPEVK